MTHPLIVAALAAPKTHKVVTTFDDGSTLEHLTASEAQANNWATGERRKVGMRLIDRATGQALLRTCVEVVAL